MKTLSCSSSKRLHFLLIAILVMLPLVPGADASIYSPADSTSAAPAPTILHPADLEKLLPASVFFRGQSAPLQNRNSGGVKFADGLVFFASLVDTSGYSSGIQEKYQAYLISEVELVIGEHHLPPGAYGVGFINHDSFIVMDIGGHDLFSTPATRDAELKRPTPLQVLAGSSPDSFKLYGGRMCVSLHRASR